MRTVDRSVLVKAMSIDRLLAVPTLPNTLCTAAATPVLSGIAAGSALVLPSSSNTVVSKPPKLLLLAEQTTEPSVLTSVTTWPGWH
jgi:hypothetical protein